MDKIVADEMTFENSDWPTWFVTVVNLAKANGADIGGAEDAWFSDYKAGLTPVEALQEVIGKPQ